MVDLSIASDDDLRKEIEKRKVASAKPEPILFSLADASFFLLQKLCLSYIDSLAGGEYFKDAEYHIFEAAITLFYGKDVWKWINERIS